MGKNPSARAARWLFVAEPLEARRLAVWGIDVWAMANDFIDVSDEEGYYNIDEAAGGSVSAGDGASAAASGGGNGGAGSVTGSATTSGGATSVASGVVWSDEAYGPAGGRMESSFRVQFDAAQAASGTAGSSVDTEVASAFASLGAGPSGGGSFASGRASYGYGAASTMVFQAGSRGDAKVDVSSNKAEAKGNGDFQAEAELEEIRVRVQAVRGTGEATGEFSPAHDAEKLTASVRVDKANDQAGNPSWYFHGERSVTESLVNMSSGGGNVVQGATDVTGQASANVGINRSSERLLADVNASAENMDAGVSGLSLTYEGDIASSDVQLGKVGWSAVEDPALPKQTADGRAKTSVGGSAGYEGIETSTEAGVSHGGTASAASNGQVYYEDQAGSVGKLQSRTNVSAVSAASPSSLALGSIDVGAGLGTEDVAVTYTGEASEGDDGVRAGAARSEVYSETTSDTGMVGVARATARGGAANQDGTGKGTITLNYSKGAKTASAQVSALSSQDADVNYKGSAGSKDPAVGAYANGEVEAQTFDAGAAGGVSDGSVNASAMNGTVGVTATGTAEGGGPNGDNVLATGYAESVFTRDAVDPFGSIEITMDRVNLRLIGNTPNNTATAIVIIEQWKPGEFGSDFESIHRRSVTIQMGGNGAFIAGVDGWNNNNFEFGANNDLSLVTKKFRAVVRPGDPLKFRMVVRTTSHVVAFGANVSGMSFAAATGQTA